jgi:exosome complex RNA-binding protein Rrp42 (RNase PH superfamily)
LENDGNLIDAFYLATIVSLSIFKKAFVKVNDKILHVYDKDK